MGKYFYQIIATVFIIALSWLWFTRLYWTGDYVLRITDGSKEFNYNFPPSYFGSGNYRLNINSPIAKCKNEDPVVLTLIKEGTAIRRMSYCPSQVNSTEVQQQGVR